MLDYYNVTFLHIFHWLIANLHPIKGDITYLIPVEFQYFETFFIGRGSPNIDSLGSRVTYHFLPRVARHEPLLVSGRAL